MSDVTVSTPVSQFGPAELAAASFLARYKATTRATYAAHLRKFYRWCDDHGVDPLAVKRPHLEMFRRYMEETRGNAEGTVSGAMWILSSFFKMLVADRVIDFSPMDAVKVRKPPMDESRILGLDRMEMGVLVRAAQAKSPTHHALVVLMGFLGLRVSEACSIDIESMHGEHRGHRTLSFVGKEGRPATVPLPVQVARVLDTCAGERTEGPLLLRQGGDRLDRRTAYRWVRNLARQAGIEKPVSPHSLRHSFVTNALQAGIPLRDVQIAARHADPRMTMYYDRARGNLDNHAAYTLAGYLSGVA